MNSSAADASICANKASSDDDDWEAIADRSSDEVFFPKLDSAIKKLTLKDTKAQTSKRRGRGSFLYKKNGLYSDQEPSGTASDVSDDEVLHPRLVEKAEIIKFKYGTSHVLVLADFPPSTRIADLEELFEKFSDRGVSIRWVNDTVALAVFRTPCIAMEAFTSIHFPFTIHILSENDSILKSIPQADLKPPCPRAKTSATTAQRLIAHGMGLKLPSPTSRSSDFRKQEEARKKRIAARQNLRDEAWGSDETS